MNWDLAPRQIYPSALLACEPGDELGVGFSEALRLSDRVTAAFGKVDGK
jgi:hypothetical protein